jgi:hypothetical protein
MERLVQIADQLIALCHVDTPWEIALGAVAVAAITGDAERGALLLEGYYSGEEADGVYDLLEAAALQKSSLAQIADKPPDDPGEWTEWRDLEGPDLPADF